MRGNLLHATLMYAAESWTWTKAVSSRLITTEMGFLRNIGGKNKRKE
jgi:hypothetical protein